MRSPPSKRRPTAAASPTICSARAHIYEACNFQDLAGQRIGKVIDLLADLDEQLTRVVSDVAVVAAPAIAVSRDGLINGPRLDGAPGHVSQTDVDLLFG